MVSLYSEHVFLFLDPLVLDSKGLMNFLLNLLFYVILLFFPHELSLDCTSCLLLVYGEVIEFCLLILNPASCDVMSLL